VFDGVGDEHLELVDAGVHPLTALLLDQRLPDLRGTTHGLLLVYIHGIVVYLNKTSFAIGLDFFYLSYAFIVLGLSFYSYVNLIESVFNTKT